MQVKNICVYGAASPQVDQKYFDVAYRLGQLIAKNGYGLVYGGGADGLMGAVARGADSEGGYIMGVVPQFLERVDGVVYENIDSLVTTRDIRDRKEIMDVNSDYFIALPGGVGTFDELMEIFGTRQLCNHDRAIVIINVDGYYDELLAMMRTTVRLKFAKPTSLELIKVVETPEEAMEYIKNYEPIELDVDDVRFFKTGGNYEGDDNPARR